MNDEIILGSDHAGFQFKEMIKPILDQLNVRYTDIGCFDENSVHYPDIGKKVVSKISDGDYDKGILICGTGIGMSIVANRMPNIRATLCYDPMTAKLSRQHNDSNVLVLGGRVMDPALLRDTLVAWLETEFEGGRHELRLNKIDAPGTSVV